MSNRLLFLGLGVFAACAGPPSSTTPAGRAGACPTPDAEVTVESLVDPITSMDSLQALVAYPREALEANVEGRVLVEVVVDSTGAVVDAEPVRGLGYGLDEEAVRVARHARFRWLLGECAGPERVATTLAIVFVLPEQ